MKITKKFIAQVKKFEIWNFFKAIKRLERTNTGEVWEKAENRLTEFNKTIISLSSSALILSFSVIKIGKFSPNKFYLGISWGLFLIVIGLGAILQFISFLYGLSSGQVERLKNDNKTLSDVFDKPEILFFWYSRSWMIWLSAIELFFFFLALTVLIITAYLSI